MSYLGFNEYPKALYHATEGMKVVADREEQDSYGDEWQETPVYPTDPVSDVPLPEPEKAKRGRKPKAETAPATAETVGQ